MSKYNDVAISQAARKKQERMEQEPKQPSKFEVTPADDITNPPQHPIPPTEMLLAQARVVKCRRELAKNAGEDLDPESWFEIRAELELALADLEEMNLHQMKWNLIQQIRQQLIQPATGMPPPGFKVPN